MLRTLLFLTAESLLFTAVLLGSWLVIKRAFALVGAPLGQLGRLTLPALWAVLFAINVVLTKQWGPDFTFLYRFSGLVLLGSVALLALCLILRR